MYLYSFCFIFAYLNESFIFYIYIYLVQPSQKSIYSIKFLQFNRKLSIYSFWTFCFILRIRLQAKSSYEIFPNTTESPRYPPNLANQPTLHEIILLITKNHFFLEQNKKTQSISWINGFHRIRLTHAFGP